MTKDVYPTLGPKTRHSTWNDCRNYMAAMYPGANYVRYKNTYKRGLSWAYNSYLFYVQDQLVGFAWPIKNCNNYWLRCKPKPSPEHPVTVTSE